MGIDLVPMKTCCYDCVFCQLGPTPHTTLERKDYAPLPDVFRELDAWLAKGEPVDILTLCGSGEPTLHAHFGEMLRHIRALGHASLLMSNGALLFDPAVRADAALADRVKISIHFWDEASFRATVQRRALPKKSVSRATTCSTKGGLSYKSTWVAPSMVQISLGSFARL